MGRLLNDHEDHSNQHEISHKLCGETGDPLADLMESQWKFPNREKAIAEQILASEEINKSKGAEL